MLRTLAYIIFLCTIVCAFTLIVLFFRSQTTTVSDTSGVVHTGDSQVMSRLEDAYSFHSAPQKDVFGAFVFHFAFDTSVADRIRMYRFEDDYSLIRRNLLLLGALYTFSDTADFFGHTMFLNDISGDKQIVRFITEIDGRAYGFEVLSDEYPNLKKLILQ